MPAGTELGAEDLRLDFQVAGFTTTAEIDTADVGIIGQHRAVEAMEFGLQARGPGYNIYVAGPVGTGRSTYVQRRLAQAAAGAPVPPDLCYVYDFAQPETPRLLSLPPGQGRRLQRDVDRLVEDLRRDLRRVFEGQPYESQRGELAGEFQHRSDEQIARIEAEARLAGFALQRGPTGIVTVPLGPQGKPLTPEMFELLPDEQQQALLERGRALEPKAAEVLRRLRLLEREGRAALQDLDRRTAGHVVSLAVDHLKEGYTGQAGVAAYLDALAQDAVDHLDLFRADPDRAPASTAEEGRLRYRVNVFVDNGGAAGAPVVAEPVPTLGHLVGRIEFKAGPAALATDFTLLRAGALQRANGGYLVLQLRELLSVPGAYEALKRSLRDRSVHLNGSAGWAGPAPLALATLSPQPVPLDVKVVLVGPAAAYQALLLHDEDFQKLFKVKVEFEADMPATPETVARHAVFVAEVCEREATPHLTAGAVARVLRHSARLAEDRTKLSARFNAIVEVVVSAGVLARAAGAATVEAAHVEQAVRDMARRSAAVEDRLLEATADEVLLVSTRGAAVGQVNGLSVINLGDYAFGRPLRITARVWAGRRGVLHIERETRMSGHVHSKGVLTIAAYLAGLHAGRQPLCMSASLAMEQMYEEIEGDSASCAELYALLSELAGLPIRQDVAVTGSVNQKGEVQPIGGVNEKVEGFFRACRAVGLTGTQGVAIPRQNVRQLVLADEVVDAVAEGRFHVWSVGHVDEGIALLTGVPAGEAGEHGAFPPESVHGRVAARLAAFARGVERTGGDRANRRGDDGPDGTGAGAP